MQKLILNKKNQSYTQNEYTTYISICLHNDKLTYISSYIHFI